MASRVDPWTLILSLVGVTAFLGDSRFRFIDLGPNWDLPKNMMLCWIISSAMVFSVTADILPHYLLFVMIPIAILAGIGFWSVIDYLWGTLTRAKHLELPESPSVLVRGLPQSARRRSAKHLMVLVLLVPLLLPLAQNLGTPGLYYSPLVGGLAGATHVIQVQGAESLPSVANFVKAHVAPGSTILMFGQVQLLYYLLPGYNVVGSGQVYPSYIQSPGAYLLLNKVEAVVVEEAGVQQFPNDAMIGFLSKVSSNFRYEYQGQTLASVYLNSTFGELTTQLLLQPELPQWKVYQGSLNATGFITVGAAETYVYEESPYITPLLACTNILAVTVESPSSNLTGMRVEITNSSGTIVYRNYFNLSHVGILPTDLSEPGIVSSGNFQVRIVAIGPPGASVDVPLVDFGCYTSVIG